MKRGLRWVAVGAGAVLVVAAAAAFVLVRSFDPEDVGRLMAEQVRAATGRTLTVGGPVEWEISLSPSIAMAQVALSNMDGGSRPEMATVERIEAQLDLLALLDGTVRIGRLLLKRPDILLESGAGNRANWDFGTADAAATEPPPDLRIGEVVVEDAVVRLRDAAAKTERRFDVRRLRLEGGSEAERDIELDGVFAGVPAKAEGTVGAPDALLRGAPLPLDLAATVAGVDVETAATITLDGDRLQVDGFEFAALGSDLAGTLVVELGGRPRIGGDLKAGTVDVAAVQAKFGATAGGRAGGDGRLFPDDPLPADALRAADVDVKIAIGRVAGLGPEITDVSLPLVLRDGVLTLDPLVLSLAGSPLRGRLAVEARRAGGMTAALKLAGSRIDFGRIADSLGEKGMVDERGDLAIDVRGGGASVRALMAGLDGDVRLSMGKGRVANGYVELASGDLLRLLGAVAGSGGSTEINCVVSRFAVKDGIARHEAFLFDTPGMTVGGTGEIDLRDERLDLVFVPRSKQAGLSIETPIAVRGTLASPAVLPDPGALAEKIGTSVLLNVINPLGPIGLLVPLVTGGAGDDGEACAEALSAARSAAGRKAGSGNEGGIGGFIKGIFGGDR